MFNSQSNGLLVGLVILVGLASPAFAFGAGNIASVSKVEGQNWRHGDIEDALLTLAMAQAIKGGKNFNKMYVARVYFGNWLRDYSQAIDVGTVKAVSAEAIRLLLCVLGFMTFGYGSAEFEITEERLGCYRPEDHIDNPKGYADGQDASQYYNRLRGPIDEETELGIDPATGMKNYIANERAGIMTSAKHVRKLFTGTVELARRYKDNGSKADLYEAMRLMGTGLHCLEDFFAHSNYCELALIEMGEQDVFPHVGRGTRMQIEGVNEPVYPITTGTFGGVDFLHSVTGEVSDKLTQNEIEELEGALQESTKADTSMLRDLLDKIPDGIFGDKHESDKVNELQENALNAQMEHTSVSPREPEEFTAYVQNLFKQIMPIIEFHDEVMKGISNAMEKIPILPKIIEQLEEQLSVFAFSLIAPFIVPLIQQIRNELKTGSDEIIASSVAEQFIVFDDDESTNPTHSMLSKDHFSNILNEIGGRCAAKMIHWVVPMLMNAIDDESVDMDRMLDTIIYGVFYHPAQRDMGSREIREGRQRSYECVKEWWQEMSDEQREEYRFKLSRKGVKDHENHKEGVHDTGHGHGCAGKLKMRKLYGGGPETLEDKIAGAAAGAIISSVTGAITGAVENQGSSGGREEGGFGGFISNILGGFNKDETETYSSSRQEQDGSHTEARTTYGQSGDRYGQAEYRETRHPDGGSSTEYSRYEQRESSNDGRTSGYGYEERRETSESGYERTERREYHGSSGDSYGERHERRDEDSYGSRHERRDEDSYGSRHERRDEGGYGGDYERRNESQGGSYGGGYERREESYGSSGRSGYSGEGREEGGYERRGEADDYRSGGYSGGGGGSGNWEQKRW